MRVTWVHPSWRDLVIDELVRDAGERRRFLACCGVDGAALALSEAGGAGGERRLPLLADDADWDALGDGLHHLCAELDDAGAVQLLSVLADARRGREHDGLTLVVLERLRRQWAGRPVDVEALAGWFALADGSLEPPSIAPTWVELEPLDAPSTPVELERFADWLRLAEVLAGHDPALLGKLGFPDRQADALAAFAAQDGEGEPPQERELRREAQRRLAWLDPEHHGRAPATAQAVEPMTESGVPRLDELIAPQRFSIERVLRDLD